MSIAKKIAKGVVATVGTVVIGGGALLVVGSIARVTNGLTGGPENTIGDAARHGAVKGVGQGASSILGDHVGNTISSMWRWVKED